MSRKTYSIKEFTAALNNLAKEVRGRALEDAAMAGGGVIETNAKMNASAGRPKLQVDTGNLVNSIQTRTVSNSGDEVKIEVGTGVEYAAIHEFGGVIEALHAPYLHFVIDGQHIQKKSVKMPARPYLRPAVDENIAAIKKASCASLAKSIEGAI